MGVVKDDVAMVSSDLYGLANRLGIYAKDLPDELKGKIKDVEDKIRKSGDLLVERVIPYVEPDGYVGCMSSEKMVEALGCALDQMERSASEFAKNSAYATASKVYASAAQVEGIRSAIVSNGGDVEIYQRSDD